MTPWGNHPQETTQESRNHSCRPPGPRGMGESRASASPRPPPSSPRLHPRVLIRSPWGQQSLQRLWSPHSQGRVFCTPWGLAQGKSWRDRCRHGLALAASPHTPEGDTHSGHDGLGVMVGAVPGEQSWACPSHLLGKFSVGPQEPRLPALAKVNSEPGPGGPENPLCVQEERPLLGPGVRLTRPFPQGQGWEGASHSRW